MNVSMTTRLLRGTLAIAAFASPIAACRAADDGAPRRDRALAFVDVTLVSMLEDRAVPGRVVVVEDGRITDIGGAGTTVVPDGATVVDGRGRYLAPALADMHVHLEYFEDPIVLELLVAEGIALVRNMDGRPYVLDWRDRTAAGELLGPRIVTAGPILDGDPPLRDDNLALGDPASARDAVRSEAEAGYDFLKVYTNLDPDVYAAIVAEAEAVGLPVAGHVPRGLGIADVMAAGQASIEHLDGYDEMVEADDSPFFGRWHWSKLYLAMPFDRDKAAVAAETTAGAGAWNTPTLVVNEKLAPLPVVRSRLENPTLAYVPPHLRDDWDPDGWDSDRLGALEMMGDEDWELLEGGRENRFALVRALHEAGAGLLAGSDMPNPFVVPGASLHEELVLLQEAGLSPFDALAAATGNAADFLGESGEWGVIRPGARADLLLLAANPLDDVANARRIEGVVLSGRWLPPGSLDSIRARVHEAYRTP